MNLRGGVAVSALGPILWGRRSYRLHLVLELLLGALHLVVPLAEVEVGRVLLDPVYIMYICYTRINGNIPD